MNLKKLTVFGSLCLLAGTLAACGKANANQSQKTLHLMQTSDLTSLDTSNTADLTQWNVLQQSMEGLYRMNAKNQVVGAMAEKVVKPTNHGKTYTFHLRPSAKWSNGDAVTAQDFVTSWRRSVSPNSTSGYNYIYEGIKNATQVSAGKKPVSSLGVQAVNDHTLKVTLSHAMPYLSKMLTMPAFFPQDHRVVAKYGKTYGATSTKMAYNGPFTVQHWTGTNDTWNLVKNSHYYDKSAIKLSKMTMQVVKDPTTAHNLFEQGELDDATVSGVTAQGVQHDKHLKHVNKAGTYYLRFNLANNHALRNQNLRRALNLVLNKAQLTKKVLSDGSTAAYNYVTPSLVTDPTTGKDFGTETKNSETYDVAKAQKLWAKGLKELGKSSVTLKLVSDDTTVSKNVDQFVQASVKQNLSNAHVSVMALPAKSTTSAVQSGNFDMDSTLWLADYADPVSFFDILTKTNPQNYGKYADATFNTQVNEAHGVNATNQKAYWQNMRTAAQRLNQTAAVLPLYNMTESHLVNQKLTGVVYHSVGENDYTRASFK
ncbi:peptide ABC transporter substrate-binding protein [Levilactobacillus zymae]|uniref:Oligopeptide ABC transporter, periplasmic oligopeptide-binding protein OppA (TC 3.A.1.5.1) n=1 Tax=Levilactobacillus zymae TaxID=267363 RepID=A0A1Y6JX97_9LACO|nr:peptide ABC transporter substrate-binding protein [Levilactobacillus zymae]KRL15199.1 oligopeptide ABC superfamily ATP binding cassette transporter substrate binding protein [Levilactobacillus zymae DSM 19395]QFR61488.1 peptide ABC transporter substrate-binding protein [Levilactobacillus zymae]GEO71632.1 peptide ABC transporter substrate-binding protein [Levilactobacillus zymae]SMS13473.1 Oligopeptide ABC transporter, periplasmic oligopeptide-binding protein OppA (TC 3.A.1.5.1) [Levilactobac